MRLATANSFDTTIDRIAKRQADLSALQERISSGKRVQRASDDPVAAVMSETTQNRLARIEADQWALDNSRTSLTQAESALGTAGGLLQDARDLLISAGNGSYSTKEYKDIALQLEGMRDQLIGVANQRDSAGRTLFGGLGGTSLPFVEVAGASGSEVRFDGLRGQEAAGTTALPQSFDGNAVFMRVPTGNGSFALSLGAGNTGSVRSDTGQVVNPSAVTGQAYSVSFADVGGAKQYSVLNTTTGLPLAGQTGQPYTPSSAIEFDGISFQVNGTPADGDTIEVAPSDDPTDVFKVIQNVIDVLRAATTSGTPEVLQTLGRSTAELDASQDRILQARSLAGAWLNRADRTDTLLSDHALANKSEQSKLVDLDMIEGITDFQNQQTGLQAALQSYAQVQRLSLFQYIS